MGLIPTICDVTFFWRKPRKHNFVWRSLIELASYTVLPHTPYPIPIDSILFVSHLLLAATVGPFIVASPWSQRSSLVLAVECFNIQLGWSAKSSCMPTFFVEKMPWVILLAAARQKNTYEVICTSTSVSSGVELWRCLLTCHMHPRQTPSGWDQIL